MKAIHKGRRSGSWKQSQRNFIQTTVYDYVEIHVLLSVLRVIVKVMFGFNF